MKQARTDFLTFVRVMHPDPRALDDWEQTTYVTAGFHELMARKLEEAIREPGRRLIITIPPRHGKSTLVSRMLPTWCMGRWPEQSIIFATYGEEFSWDFGRDVRGFVEGERFKAIFPGVHLRKGAKAQDRLQTTRGGLTLFAGKGGQLTGRGAHLLLLDDLIKDDEEASSENQRDKDWRWLTRVAFTRLMDDTASIILIMTRWSYDDPVGRLTDPQNPEYSEEEGQKWEIINLPALAERDDPLGREPGEALWPERFSAQWLRSQRNLDPQGFTALYQQRPTLEEGDYFKADHFQWYKRKDHPPISEMRIFAASDHALGQDKKKHDQTVLLVAGVDHDDNIWLLDCFWDRVPTDVQCARMVDMMKRWPIIKWWMEKGLIGKSIGPFLYREMRDRGVYCAIEPIVPSANKEVRARSIQGFLAHERVHFPRNAWGELARQEMLRFPAGANDDFVDAIAYLGMQLQMLTGRGRRQERQAPKRFTAEWWRRQELVGKPRPARRVW